MTAPVDAFAPGRLVLFGDEQDELGLSVITLAIDRGARVRLEPVAASSAFEVGLHQDEQPELRATIAIDGSSAPTPDGCAPEDWLRRSVQELVRAGARFPSGARIELTSDLPPRASCGSRAANVVALLRALVTFAAESARPLAEPRRLAELAGSVVTRSRMDALASSLGGLLHLHFGPTPFVQELETELEGFVLIDAGEAAEPEAAGAARRAAVGAALAQLQAVDPGFDAAAISYESVWNVLLEAAASDASPAATRDRERLVFTTLLLRDVTLAALRVMAETPLDRARLGELLDDHHERLRDGLGRSTPRIESAREAVRAAGALGVKLSGSGLLAYAPEREQAVIDAATKLGARAQVVRPTRSGSFGPPHAGQPQSARRRS